MPDSEVIGKKTWEDNPKNSDGTYMYLRQTQMENDDWNGDTTVLTTVKVIRDDKEVMINTNMVFWYGCYFMTLLTIAQRKLGVIFSKEDVKEIYYKIRVTNYVNKNGVTEKIMTNSTFINDGASLLNEVFKMEKFRAANSPILTAKVTFPESTASLVAEDFDGKKYDYTIANGNSHFLLASGHGRFLYNPSNITVVNQKVPNTIHWRGVTIFNKN